MEQGIGSRDFLDPSLRKSNEISVPTLSWNGNSEMTPLNGLTNVKNIEEGIGIDKFLVGGF